MKLKGVVRVVVILLALTLNIGCDQYSKLIVRRKMSDYTQIGFLNNHVIIGKVENTGAFLSLGNSLTGSLRFVLLNLLPLLAVAFGLVFMLVKTDLHKVTLIALILIIGGGFGNIYDRIIHGSVTDFLYIDFVIFHTGVFNVADMSITTGTFILLIHAYMVREPKLKDSQF